MPGLEIGCRAAPLVDVGVPTVPGGIRSAGVFIGSILIEPPQTILAPRGRHLPSNPDVLSCLANLSNDEVFTPPEVANAMLDMLPQELFSNPKTTFLDPGTKSGVFLREIVKRLLVGLEDQIPDLQTRLDHIMHEQVFGIAITEMTSLLARRSVYCSKYPNSKYSVYRVCRLDEKKDTV